MSDVTDYEFGISAIDSGYQRPQLGAIHLIVEGGRAAIVDTGVNSSVPRVLDALRVKGIAPAQVDYVILTHIHLDHAGGAGLLLSQLPNAMLTVHPRGARHIIDPGKADCEHACGVWRGSDGAHLRQLSCRCRASA